MVAALSSDHKYLNLAVVNATESEQKLDLDVTGARLEGPSTLWRLTGKDLQATNQLGREPQVTVKEIAIEGAPNSLSVAPISINIFRIPLAGGAQ